MTGTADERLIVMLEARITEFEKRMKKAEGTGTKSYKNLQRGSKSATRQMEADMTRSTGRINQALAGTSAKIGSFAALLPAAFVAAGVKVTQAAMRTVHSIAQIGDEARRSGLGVEQFQELSYVAGQARIPVDALTDGIKELNLRADEWIVTGGGPAADAFQRLGYDADELARALKEPDKLFEDIIGRMGDLDTAAQIRIADEVFGGSAGERFVELLAMGRDGIRQLRQEARDMGVLDQEQIDRAQELDRKWNALTARVQTFYRSLVLGAVDAVASLGDIDEALAAIQRRQEDMARRPASVGQNAGFLDDDQVIEYADEIATLNAAHTALQEEARLTAMALAAARDSLDPEKYAEAWRALDDLTLAMQDLIRDFELGDLSAEDFETRLGGLTSQASTAVEEIARLDNITFPNVTALLSNLTSALSRVAAAAASVRSVAGTEAMASTEDPRGDTGNVANYVPPGVAPRSSLRPEARDSHDIDFGYAGPATAGAAAAGGGGAAQASAFEGALADLRGEIAALEQETAAYEAAVGSGLPNALDYARKRAELLTAAQEDGREITPELAAEIDQLAQSYANAGQAAEDAADRITDMQDNASRGADAIGDLFGQVLDGSKSAKEAIADLILEIARVQMMKGLQGMAGMNGGANAFGWLGSLLSFDGGGYTGNGARSGGLDGKGGQLAMLHPRETVIDHTRGQTPQAGGTLEIRLGPGLEASWLNKAAAQSVKITSAGMAHTSKASRSNVMSQTERFG